MSKTQDEIRDRAYALWIEAGSPDGRDQEFWHRAEAELAEHGDLDRSEQDATVPQPRVVVGTVPQ